MPEHYSFSEHRLIFLEGGETQKRVEKDPGDPAINKKMIELQEAVKERNAFARLFQEWMETKLGQDLPSGHSLSVGLDDAGNAQNLILKYKVGTQQELTIPLDPMQYQQWSHKGEDVTRAVRRENGTVSREFSVTGLEFVLEDLMNKPEDNALKNWVADMRAALESGDTGSVKIGIEQVKDAGSVDSRGSEGSRGSRNSVNSRGSVDSRGSEGSRGSRNARGSQGSRGSRNE